MPIYEYVCTACNAVSEVLQGIKDDPLTNCCVCAKPAVKRLMSATGFRLKGGDWYATEYQNAPQKKQQNEI